MACLSFCVVEIKNLSNNTYGVERARIQKEKRNRDMNGPYKLVPFTSGRPSVMLLVGKTRTSDENMHVICMIAVENPPDHDIPRYVVPRFSDSYLGSVRKI